MHRTWALHIRSSNVRIRTNAAPFRSLSLLILAVMLLGLPFGICTAAQSDPPGSQTDINNAAQAAYQAGNAAIKNNDWKTAETEFEKVVRLVPQIEEGHSSLGAVLMRLGKLSQAISELEKALALNPRDVAAETNVALAYEETGTNRKAVSAFEKLEAA